MEDERQEKSVEVMYGAEDLGSSALFPEGWINFGYFDRIDPKTRLVRERVEASKDLYRLIHQRLDLDPSHRVVEVGSGRGHGIGLLITERKIHDAVGVDITPEQVERANRIYAGYVASYMANFLVGPAEKLPIRDSSADRLYSVEAIQHFRNPEAFCQQAFRVLKPAGKIVLTSFFLTAAQFGGPLREKIPTVQDGIDLIFPIEQLRVFLENSGFTEVAVQSIGAQVWDGFDNWVAFVAGEHNWGREWKLSAQRGWIDYYVISASKP